METRGYWSEEMEMKGQLKDELMRAAGDALSRLRGVERESADRSVQESRTSDVSTSYIEAIEREQFFSPEAKGESSLKRMLMALEKKQEDLDDYPFTRNAFRELYKELIQTHEPDKVSGTIRLKDHPKLKLSPEGDLFGPYKEVHAYLSERGLTGSRKDQVMGFETHHLLADRFMRDFGISRGDGIAVAVYPDEHMELVHGEFGVDFELPRGVRYNIKDVVEGHVEAYHKMGRPEWAEQVLRFIRDNKEMIMEAYESGRVPWATSEDVEKARNYLNSWEAALCLSSPFF